MLDSSKISIGALGGYYPVSPPKLQVNGFNSNATAYTSTPVGDGRHFEYGGHDNVVLKDINNAVIWDIDLALANNSNPIIVGDYAYVFNYADARDTPVNLYKIKIADGTNELLIAGANGHGGQSFYYNDSTVSIVGDVIHWCNKDFGDTMEYDISANLLTISATPTHQNTLFLEENLRVFNNYGTTDATFTIYYKDVQYVVKESPLSFVGSQFLRNPTDGIILVGIGISSVIIKSEDFIRYIKDHVSFTLGEYIA